jgi:16S rRNA (guanine527-N7)-methyltransferase
MLKYYIGDSMKTEFMNLLKSLDIELSEQQYDQFQTYYRLLVEWNDKINLTAITDERDVFVKHFYDSICLVKGIKLSKQTLLDVGSGAGFPSIPLKIAYPDLKVTIIDALNKRIKFLNLLVRELNLEVELIHGRAEEYQRKHCFDLVTARAVANLTMLSELCIPFAKVNGNFIAMKGPRLSDELKASTKAIELLGGKVVQDVHYLVDNQERHLLVVKKVKKSEKKYPRKFSNIKNNPL